MGFATWPGEWTMPTRRPTLAAADGRRSWPTRRRVTGDAGSITTAAIAAYGETRHLFVERSGWHGVWGPGYTAERLPPRPAGDPVGCPVDRPRGGQRRTRASGRLGELVPRSTRVRGDAPLRRRPDLHPVFGAALDGAAQRRRHGHAHQRACPRPREEPDHRVPGGLSWRGGTAHRAGHAGHRDIGRSDASSAGFSFLQMPSTYYEDAKRRVRASTFPGPICSASTSRWMSMPAATCCRSSPRP